MCKYSESRIHERFHDQCSHHACEHWKAEFLKRLNGYFWSFFHWDQTNCVEEKVSSGKIDRFHVLLFWLFLAYHREPQVTSKNSSDFCSMYTRFRYFLSDRVNKNVQTQIRTINLIFTPKMIIHRFNISFLFDHIQYYYVTYFISNIIPNSYIHLESR